MMMAHCLVGLTDSSLDNPIEPLVPTYRDLAADTIGDPLGERHVNELSECIDQDLTTATISSLERMDRS